MPTIAIVGAGPGLGQSIARTFGAHGFSVALVARTQSTLDALVADLQQAGVEAAAFTADVMDPASVASAFDRIKDRFGTVEVLEYSPAPHATPVPGLSHPDPREVGRDTIQPQLDYYLYGAIAATEQVLPAMLERSRGSILYTTGGTSLEPLAGPAEFATTTIGSGALRSYALKLHQATADTGVYVAHIPLFAWIGSGGPESQPATIAEHYWTAHITREGAELPYRAL